MSQEALGERAGAKRLTQLRYESDKRSPDAMYLAKVADAGGDVLYIVTGKRTQVGAVPPVNIAVLRQVIEGVEEILTTTRRKTDPAKKAEAIVLLYEHFQIAGRVERGFIERQLRLVA